jgi:ACR3 family arsenite transporter
MHFSHKTSADQVSDDLTSSNVVPHNPPTDVERQKIEETIEPDKVSAIKGLGWLDRFLAVWIILAMAIGILLGNFVPQTGPALERGKFVGVSVPIGKFGNVRCMLPHL